MMSLRVVCFILMVTVTPYSWYTWLFAIGAAVLPYLAVVVANVSAAPTARKAEPPMRPLEARAAPAPEQVPAEDDGIIRLHESAPRPDTVAPPRVTDTAPDAPAAPPTGSSPEDR